MKINLSLKKDLEENIRTHKKLISLNSSLEKSVKLILSKMKKGAN